MLNALGLTDSVLSKVDRDAVRNLETQLVDYGPGEIVVREGKSLGHCHILLRGMSFRYRESRGLVRQITSFQIEGDICDIHGLFFPRMNFSVAALTVCRFAVVSHRSLSDLMEASTTVSTLLWQSTLRDAAIEREWLMNIGQRTDDERVAHLLSEILTRLQGAELYDGREFKLQITASELSSAIVRPVGVIDLVLQRLAAAGFVVFDEGGIAVLDLEGLKTAGRFDAAYLDLRETH